MPLNHENAMASISVSGLALGCYNPQTSKWEVAFLRHPQHTLTIEVTSMMPNGSSRTRFEIDQHHRIFVDAENAIDPAQPLFKSDPFDRRAEQGNDPEDIRWIVDIENDLNNGQQVALKRPEFPVTEMFVSRPVLYADRTAVSIDNLKLVSAVDQADVRPFGKLSEIIKADIACNEGGAVVLRIDGPLGFSIRLPRVPGKTHTIVMDNICRSVLTTPASDFTVYYSVVESTQGTKFDFRRESDGSRSADAICTSTHLGASHSLLPLP